MRFAISRFDASGPAARWTSLFAIGDVAGDPMLARLPWAASGRALTLDRPESRTKLLIDPDDLTIHRRPALSETLMEPAQSFFAHATHIHRPSSAGEETGKRSLPDESLGLSR